ncbi:MAG: PQQ-binding-like beta-propeller repeat protein [Chrysiogenetes bacterium]|nr:PQQ-binding-like beta-propeller repeat protein [Chrysiogenetes bacterium]
MLAAMMGGCVWFDAAGWGSSPGDYPPRLSREWTRQLPRRGRYALDFPYIQSLPSELSQPVAVGERVFVGTSAGVAAALEKEGGNTLWEVELSDNPITSRAVADEQTVVFAGLSGTLWGRSVEDGTEKWTAELDVPILDALALYEGRVIVQDAHGALSALAIADGRILWKIDGKEPRGLSARALGAPVIDEISGHVYWARWDGVIQAASIASGSVLWQSNYGGGRAGFQSTNIGMTLVGSSLYAARFSGPVFKIRADDGIAVWQSENIEAAAGPAANYNQVFVPLQGGGMAALDATLGSRIEGWGADIPEDWGVLSQPKILGEWVVAVTTETENRWWPPRVTQSGRVIALDTGAFGQFSWFSKIQTGSYGGLSSGEDWVAVLSDRAIAQLWHFEPRTDARPDIDYAAEIAEQRRLKAEKRAAQEAAAAEKARREAEPSSFWDNFFSAPDEQSDDEYLDELSE